MRTPILMLAAAMIVATACGSDNSSAPPVSKILNFTASLTPAGEVGATLAGNPTGSGTFTATLDTSTNLFTWNVTFAGLTSNVNNGHIHGPFVVGGTVNSTGVLLNFNPAVVQPGETGLTFVGLNSATAGSASGSITLNATPQFTTTVNGDSLRKLILAGNAYVNIHTVTNAGGEIRGQIARKP